MTTSQTPVWGGNISRLIFPLVIMCCLIISYWPVVQKMAIRWETGDNSYCYLIIPLFLFLCWEKRNEFHFGQLSWNLWGLLPVGLSLVMMISGELGSVETMLYTGMWICIVGVMSILYGKRLRQLLFPILVLAFIVPMPPFINRLLTFNLKLAASSLSAMLLRLTGVSVLQDGNIIDLGVTQLQVVDACSGLRYFMPLILMALLFGYFYERRLWQKIVLLVLVLPLSIVVNGLRIFFTGMLHVWNHPELAENFFHDFSGWLVFMVAAAILLGASLLLRKIGPLEKPIIPKDPGAGNKPLKLQIAVTATLCLLFAGSGWALQKRPSAANLPDRKSFDAFPMRIGGWQATRHYLSKDILNSLWADDYVDATFVNPELHNTVQLLIPFYEYQGTRHTAHAPQSCMLGSGWALVSSKDHAIHLNPHGTLNIKTMTWEKDGYKLLGGYFFFQRGRVITSPWMNKFYLMWDAFTRRRTDGALVRVEMSIAPGQSTEEAYKVLEGFVAKLWPLLPEYVPR